MDYKITKIPSLNQPPNIKANDILAPSQPLPKKDDETHIIEMNFGNQSERTVLPNERKLKKEEEPKNFNYVYALLYEGNITFEEARVFVEKHLQPIAESARVTYLPKEKQYLLWVQDKEADKIQDLIQAVLDNDKYIYVNDGSDVIFRPGMTYNQLNHQRIQLMNYRCFLDRNDAKKFKNRVRPIFLNKQYWITEDGKEFAQTIKDAITRAENIGQEKSGTKVEYHIDYMMIRKWIEKGLVYAQYESLKYKRQDYNRISNKNDQVLEAIKKIDKDLREMRKIYKYRLREWKKRIQIEDEKFIKE